MPQAYTPGLRVTRHATLIKQRRLPLPGTVLVSVGDPVEGDREVARTDLPGKVTAINLVNRLSITAEELPDYVLKQVGDPIEAGEAIAETRPWIKWFKTTIESPITGTIDSISTVTGQILLREPPRPVVVNAFVDGTVVAVREGQGVDVETGGPYIQGIFGVGGETRGILKRVSSGPDEDLSADQIEQAEGCVLLCGRRIDLAAIERARKAGAVAIIGGCIEDEVLRAVLGYDIGVAITGTEAIGLTVIVTEGFGTISMATRTFDILSENDGRVCSVSGATQIRAGVQRPEVIFPTTTPHAAGSDSASVGLTEGAPLRGIRAPYFGKIGRVVALPSELHQVESGARVRVLEVEFDDGTRALVPRANIELIES
ncbi:MAG: hypothetical protein CME26_01860 [Gemmatimonadetes bacterium]|nr:hypothetical protein [Gemmatimonadota bacterium]